MTREIPLSQGLVALVDDADYDRVMAGPKWFAEMRGHTVYARRWIKVDGKRRGVFLHTQLTGWPRVDHVNLNGLDNRRANLRPATRAQNGQNRRLPSSRSGLKGVTRHVRGMWTARVQADGTRLYLGLFATPEEAARAYDAAALELHGEFARLNFGEPVR